MTDKTSTANVKAAPVNSRAKGVMALYTIIPALVFAGFTHINSSLKPQVNKDIDQDTGFTKSQQQQIRKEIASAKDEKGNYLTDRQRKAMYEAQAVGRPDRPDATQQTPEQKLMQSRIKSSIESRALPAEGKHSPWEFTGAAALILMALETALAFKKKRTLSNRIHGSNNMDEVIYNKKLASDAYASLKQNNDVGFVGRTTHKVFGVFPSDVSAAISNKSPSLVFNGPAAKAYAEKVSKEELPNRWFAGFRGNRMAYEIDPTTKERKVAGTVPGWTRGEEDLARKKKENADTQTTSTTPDQRSGHKPNTPTGMN